MAEEVLVELLVVAALRFGKGGTDALERHLEVDPIDRNARFRLQFVNLIRKGSICERFGDIGLHGFDALRQVGALGRCDASSFLFRRHNRKVADLNRILSNKIRNIIFSLKVNY